jgi:hypothetical protein
MQHILFIALILISTVSFAQTRDYYKIDTLQIEHERTLVRYAHFADNQLKSEREAWFYPVEMKVPRFNIFGNGIFTKYMEADSIAYHGYSLIIEDNGCYRNILYENGKALTTQYFNATGESISGLEFLNQNENYLQKPFCGELMGVYFFRGKGKRR